MLQLPTCAQARTSVHGAWLLLAIRGCLVASLSAAVWIAPAAPSTVFARESTQSAERMAPFALAPGYAVKDSQWPAVWESHQRIHWIDNQRILFLGKGAIYVWDLAGNRVSKYAAATYVTCFAAGYIRYRGDTELVYPPGGRPRYRAVWRYGQMGAERTEEVTAENADRVHLLEPERDRVVCEDSNDLRREHGRLERGASKPGGDEAVKWYPQGQTNPRVLPIPVSEGSVLRYYGFNDTYLLFGDQTANWWEASAKVDTLWLFRPNGEVQRIKLPQGPWSFSGGAVRLTRAGVLTGTHAGGPHAGLYLIQGERVVRVFAGLNLHPTVSPDGCGVAFVALSTTNSERATLQTMEVCGRAQ